MLVGERTIQAMAEAFTGSAGLTLPDEAQLADNIINVLTLAASWNFAQPKDDPGEGTIRGNRSLVEVELG